MIGHVPGRIRASPVFWVRSRPGSRRNRQRIASFKSTRNATRKSSQSPILKPDFYPNLKADVWPGFRAEFGACLGAGEKVDREPALKAGLKPVRQSWAESSPTPIGTADSIAPGESSLTSFRGTIYGMNPPTYGGYRKSRQIRTCRSIPRERALWR